LKKGVAFFDFDGTIYKKDSMIEFLKLVYGPFKVYLFCVLNIHFIIAYFLKFYSNEKLKLRFIKKFFKSKNASFFNKFQIEFKQLINSNLYPYFHETIEFHREKKHTIYILSASLSIYLEDWCKQNGFNLIATELEVTDNLFSGNLNGKNCHGIEKWHRIKELIKEFDPDQTYGYGDSKSDLHFINKMKFQFFGNLSKTHF
jgi:phosphatidylglycerophosphatase C